MVVDCVHIVLSLECRRDLAKLSPRAWIVGRQVAFYVLGVKCASASGLDRLLWRSGQRLLYSQIITLSGGAPLSL